VSLPVAAPAAQTVAEPVPGLRIVHDDEHIVVVDKPVGVAAHPSPGWTGPTVVGGLAGAGYRISTSGAAERQGVVHRLDVGTSGLMAVAKSELAYTLLKQAFRDRTVDKHYNALVHGHPDPMTGTVDAPIDRHPKHDYKWAVRTGGRDSITHYDTIEAFRHATLLDIKLETGRTHQIRAHLAGIGHPVVGDPTYGRLPGQLPMELRAGLQKTLQRQALHAWKLQFKHPITGKLIQAEAKIPADYLAARALLKAPV